MAPVAAFPWNVAKMIWVIILLISFAMTVWALVPGGEFHWSEPRDQIFVAACLALAPFHTGFASGNSTILVIGMCALAIRATQNRRDIAAGILFGLACTLKPHIGAPLVLYYLLRRRWSMFLTALGSTLAMATVAVLRLQLLGVSWTRDYLHNAQGFVTANQIDDFSSLNPGRFMLINLQVPFFSITGHRSSANLLAWAVGGFLLCIWLFLVVRSRNRETELLALSAVSIIGLLPVYHRFYDAGFLVIPLCWCMTRPMGQAKNGIKLTLLLMSPFLLPGSAFLQQLSLHGRVSDAVIRSWWWNCIVMPHETWALLLLSLVLLYEMTRSPTTSQLPPVPTDGFER